MLTRVSLILTDQRAEAVYLYAYSASDKLDTLLRKMKKKDRVMYERIGKKISELCEYPHMAKPMESDLKGTWRVHVGHFVLFYRINEDEKKLEFYDFEHHDKAYH